MTGPRHRSPTGEAAARSRSRRVTVVQPAGGITGTAIVVGAVVAGAAAFGLLQFASGDVAPLVLPVAALAALAGGGLASALERRRRVQRGTIVLADLELEQRVETILASLDVRDHRLHLPPGSWPQVVTGPAGVTVVGVLATTGHLTADDTGILLDGAPLRSTVHTETRSIVATLGVALSGSGTLPPAVEGLLVVADAAAVDPTLRAEGCDVRFVHAGELAHALDRDAGRAGLDDLTVHTTLSRLERPAVGSSTAS